MIIRWVCFLLFAAFSLAGCAPQNSNVNQTADTNSAGANAKWDAYVDQFITDHFTANPHFGVYQGRHEFDGKLPDWSADGLNHEIARLKGEREKATAFKDADLDERQRFERDYLQSLLTAHTGNLAAAARQAGMDRKNLWALAKKHGLELGRFRK